MYILLDTGSSNTILSDKYLGQVTSIKKSKSEYAIAGGLYTTSKQVTLTFKLPKFSNSKRHYMVNGYGQWKTRGTWL